MWVMTGGEVRARSVTEDNPLARGLVVRRNKNWVSPTWISVYPSSSIVIQPPTYGAPLNLERMYHFFSLPLPQLHISRLIVMTSLCRTHNLSSPDHPQSNILKPSLMWGAIIEKKGKKEENLAAILPDVNPCANIIEAHNRIFLPKLTARVWNLSKYVLTFSPSRPTGPNWWPTAFHSNHFAEANCWRLWRLRLWG